MIKVEKLNKTIDGLEKEIEGIKSAKKIYQDLCRLEEEVSANKDHYKELIANIEKVSNDIGNASSILNGSLDEFGKALNTTKENFDNNVIEINSKNDEVNQQLIKGYQKYEESIVSKLCETMSVLNDKYEGLSKDMDSKYDNLDKKYSEGLSDIKSMLDSGKESLNKDISTLIDSLNSGIGDMSNQSRNTNTQLLKGYSHYENDIGERLTAINGKLENKYQDFKDEISSKYDKLNKEYLEKIEQIKESIALSFEKASDSFMVRMDKSDDNASEDIQKFKNELAERNTLLNEKILLMENTLKDQRQFEELNAKTLKIMVGVNITLIFALVLVILVLK